MKCLLLDQSVQARFLRQACSLVTGGKHFVQAHQPPAVSERVVQILHARAGLKHPPCDTIVNAYIKQVTPVAVLVISLQSAAEGTHEFMRVYTCLFWCVGVHSVLAAYCK